ncbi:fumarylacetoacetate hydrolase family protein [Streptomyces sp. NBC_00457]|uniref:hypothetical protein n=1 Tax=Streptomyces sp. NBC_00457 TaxID=2975748 RepID=UPI002E201605
MSHPCRAGVLRAGYGGRVVVGADDDICLPAEEQNVRWGAELGVVSARRPGMETPKQP